MCLNHLAAVSFSCHDCGLMRMFMGLGLFVECLSARAFFSCCSWLGVREGPGGSGGDDDDDEGDDDGHDGVDGVDVGSVGGGVGVDDDEDCDDGGFRDGMFA